MGKNDMNHMAHLETVALSDCAVLSSKEATYQGSWKRSGGASAWFMFKRNMDRMITMLAPKEFPEHIQTPQNVHDTLRALDDMVHYAGNATKTLPGSIEATRQILEMLGDRFTSEDIFMKIRQQPSGADGTVLACLRDMRRYAILVEAEMIAEGVVEPEEKTHEYYPQDIYSMIADETGLDREEVKKRCHRACYGSPDVAAVLKSYEMPYEEYTLPKASVIIAAGDGDDSAKYFFPNAHSVNIQLGAEDIKVAFKLGIIDPPAEPPPPRPPGEPPFHHPNPAQQDAEFRSNGGYAKEQAERHSGKPRDLMREPVIADGMVYEAGRPPRPATDADRAAAAGKPSAVSQMRQIGDEAVHASLVPWQIGDSYRNVLIDRVGVRIVEAFFNKRAVDVYRLEPTVDGVHKCPREISDAYEWWTMQVKTDDINMRVNRWVLKLDKVPDELKDQFPRLQAEMNQFEFEQSPNEYRFMYSYTGDSSQKWVLSPEFQAWARES